ncbi:MAG: hypothetical protein QM345_10400, partial [Bacillota bacterium]|nr:hypothetical protein [Bacillota bacterium]
QRNKYRVLLTLNKEKIIIEYEDNNKEFIDIQELTGLSTTFLDMVEFFLADTKYRLTFDPKKHMSVKLFYDLLIKLKEDNTNELRLVSDS